MDMVGVKTDNMKMSMFDVSDVENPKEMFSVDIGRSYTYSDILYNHKLLFNKKSENLIGFPITYNNKTEYIIFEIDMQEGFKEYFKIQDKSKFSYAQRIIYIEDILYILNSKSIISYDLNTFEELKQLDLD